MFWLVALLATLQSTSAHRQVTDRVVQVSAQIDNSGKIKLDWPDVASAAERFQAAEQHVVQDAAHLATMERPDVVAAIVLEFLAQTSRRQA